MLLLLLLITSIVFGVILTRLARNSAKRFHLLDAPDGGRKLQTQPVPVAGGVAVLTATILVLFIGAFSIPELAEEFSLHKDYLLVLTIAAIWITFVGVIDDARNLRPLYKLAGQVVAIAILMGPGDLRIDFVSLLGWVVHLDVLAIPLTAFWLLACVNALNLIDGMDGLLGTVGLIALLSLAIIAAMTGNIFTAAIAVTLAGAVAGFLWFNLPPASVYMGDSGSMLIGLVIGALAIPASLKGPATVTLGAMVALVLLPMLDTTAAVIRRQLTGRGLSTADRSHLHHVLLRRGMTVRRTLIVLASFGLIAATGALVTTALQNDLYALISVAGVLLSLLITRLFGNAEWSLIRARVGSATRGLWQNSEDARPWEIAVRLQGTADWERIWESLASSAERLGLRSLCLDVNSLVLHESYHARWDKSCRIDSLKFHWKVEVPLVCDGYALGRITFTGLRDASSMTTTLLELSKVIESVESRTREITTRIPTRTLPHVAAPSVVSA